MNKTLETYSMTRLGNMESFLRGHVNTDGSDVEARRKLLAVTAEIGRRRNLAEEALKPKTPLLYLVKPITCVLG